MLVAEQKPDDINISYLVHGEGLHLSLEDAHPAAGDHRPHVRDDRLAEDLVNQPMVSLVTSC